jgi:hypothetical protein
MNRPDARVFHPRNNIRMGSHAEEFSVENIRQRRPAGNCCMDEESADSIVHEPLILIEEPYVERVELMLGGDRVIRIADLTKVSW